MKIINQRKFFDNPVYFFILSNFITIIWALVEKWDVFAVIFIYWFQSVIIGLFNFYRIISLKNFSTDNFTINNHPVKPSLKVKWQTALFFLFHYGFFHFVYLVFLTALDPDIILFLVNKWLYLAAMVGMFFLNHLYSFYEYREELKIKQNIGRVMFRPYIRIIPMHLIIIFIGSLSSFGLADSGVGYALTLTLFLFFKSIADIGAHFQEHQQFGKN